MDDSQKRLHAVAPDRKTGDAAARAAALDITQSWIVEAPAGSGKTELLMQRFLRLLAHVEQPEQVLAITFTRKAAAEMRDRIVESLREAQNNVPLDPQARHKHITRELALTALEADATLAWNLVRQPQRLNIRTIDSLCSQIAGRLPVLSQLGGAMQPVEHAADLYRLAAQATLQEIGGSDTRLRAALFTLLLHLDNQMDRIVELITAMLGSRDQWGRIFPIAQEHSDEELDTIIHERFEKPLQRNAEEALQRTFELLDPATWSQIFDLARYQATTLGDSGPGPARNPAPSTDVPPARHPHLAEWQAVVRLLLTNEGGLRKPSGINKKIGFAAGQPRTQQLQSLLGSLQERSDLAQALTRLRAVPPAQYEERQRAILRASFLVLRHAIARLKTTFAQTGRSDFVEVALAARQALADDADSLAQTFGTAIRHLLVDEMQDTSLTQYEIFSQLVENWDGHSQTIFLVGDPKQSIYRFRHVEVGLFARTRREGLGGVALNHLQLSGNFRSHQSLVLRTNQDFARIFARQSDVEADSDAIEFTASQAAHCEPLTERVFWHPHIVEYRDPTDPVGGNSEESPQDVEAREICDLIAMRRAHTPPGQNPPSMAILIRARTHVATLLRQMRARQIPYRAVDLDTLADRQPVLDALALTRCLLHSEDRVAWLAALRAPWCGLTLADLQILCGSDEPAASGGTVAERLRARIPLLSGDGQVRAARTWKALELATRLLSTERLSMVVERLWHTLGGPECVEAAEMPAIREFFRLLEKMEAENAPIHAGQLEARMKDLFAPPDPGADAPVEVLTLFKAKGLEWDIVLMPGLHRGTSSDKPGLLSWIEELPTRVQPSEGVPDIEGGASTIYLAPIKRTAEEREPISQWIRAKRAERESAELKRLLYVGWTRARRELHLFVQCKQNKDGGLREAQPKSLLRTAWPVASAIFEQQLQAQGAPSAPATKVAAMPSPASRPESSLPGKLTSLAAEAPEEQAEVARIPLSNFRRVRPGWQPVQPPPDVPLRRESHPAAVAEAFRMFQRPQGSWLARIFGTVVHAFLEPLARILEQAGEPPARPALQLAVEQLHRPIQLQLMRSGLETRDAEAAATRVRSVLLQVADDAVGRWVLARHAPPIAGMTAFEIPLTALYQGAQRSIRVDRMFLGGETPEVPGENFIWIVDFKTSHTSGDVEKFLAAERDLYREQMRAYAAIAQAACPQRRQVRLGLYYPLLQRFSWWAQDCPPVAGEPELRGSMQ